MKEMKKDGRNGVPTTTIELLQQLINMIKTNTYWLRIPDILKVSNAYVIIIRKIFLLYNI